MNLALGWYFVHPIFALRKFADKKYVHHPIK